jgi:hypothetical protein
MFELQMSKPVRRPQPHASTDCGELDTVQLQEDHQAHLQASLVDDEYVDLRDGRESSRVNEHTNPIPCKVTKAPFVFVGLSVYPNYRPIFRSSY